MVSDFVADCRRIDEWGIEQGRATLDFIKARPGQKLGVDFTLEDLPLLTIDLPSHRKAFARSGDRD